MSAIPEVPLSECCEIVSGATPKTGVAAYWDGDIPWATPKDLGQLSDKYISDTPRKITREGRASCGATLLPAGSVLFSSRAPIGHVAINTIPMATNQGFKSFVPKPEYLDASYLYQWLRANRPYLESLGNGATFKEVSKAVVGKVEIPLPPIGEQRRIAEVLDRVDGLCAQRRESVALLDELARSVFLDMFGDPMTNPRGWPVRPVSELGRVTTGNTPPRSNAGNYGTSIEWIKSDNIDGSRAHLTRASEGLSAEGMKIARIVEAGSLLVTCIAGSEASIGTVAIADRQVAFNQQINALTPLRENSLFLYHQLRLAKPLILEKNTGGMKCLVSKSRFGSVTLMDPPPAAQDEFSRRAGAILKLQDAHRSHLAELRALFASLQHRAFHGTSAAFSA